MKVCQSCALPLVGNQRKNCKPCSLEARRIRCRAWHATHKEQRRKRSIKNHQSPSYRWHLLKQNAKKRNLEVNINEEQFKETSKLPCIYCLGLLDKDSGWGTHIDRLDNSKGYIIGNIASCCGFCNSIKQHHLSVDETKAVINLIIEMRRLNVE